LLFYIQIEKTKVFSTRYIKKCNYTYKKGGIDSNRMVDFINKFINGKYKNKLIFLDNTSSHRNQLVKDGIEKDNNLLYTVPYQH